MNLGDVFVDTGAWFAIQAVDDEHHVDATSFAFMRRRRVRHAFAFDVHFRTAGFLRIPVDLPFASLE